VQLKGRQQSIKIYQILAGWAGNNF
jgi:hypothetical protein